MRYRPLWRCSSHTSTKYRPLRRCSSHTPQRSIDLLGEVHHTSQRSIGCFGDVHHIHIAEIWRCSSHTSLAEFAKTSHMHIQARTMKSKPLDIGRGLVITFKWNLRNTQRRIFSDTLYVYVLLTLMTSVFTTFIQLVIGLD